MPAKSQVFVSYAADTKPLAEQLTRALEQQGFGTWADFKDARPGQRWRDEINRALDKAQSFVILVRPNSPASAWQETEWQAVLEKAWSDPHKRMIPVVVGGKEPPPFLRNWVALRVDPVAEPIDWTRRVLRYLRTEPKGVRGLSAKDRQERQQRLRQISRAADEFAQREAGTGEFPIISKY